MDFDTKGCILGESKLNSEPKEATDMRKLFAALMAIAIVGVVIAQDAQSTPANPFAFQGGIDLGTDALPTGAGGTVESWTRLGFQPEVSFGKFGIGLDLTLRFQLYPEGSSNAMRVYRNDWVPGDGKNFLDIYLPKLLYIRYGIKGEDPLFAKLGSINDLTLGNGFIVGNYSNMSFLPDLRLFGLDFGVDGSLFDFPMVGFEGLTGNLARLDVVGGRLFVRPFVTNEMPILKGLQLGFTGAFDTAPDLYATTTNPAKTIGVFGMDTFVPLNSSGLFPMAAFADLAYEPNKSAGGMVGVGGRIIAIFTYGAQLRILGAGFIPTYFDANYDLYKAQKFDFMQQSPSGNGLVGWYASLGTSLLRDKLVLMASLDGPFKAAERLADPRPATAAQTDYPHARAVFRLADGVLGGFFFDASYEKYFIGAAKPFFPDLVDPADAVIGLAINYKTGASVLTLKYDARWNTTTQQFDVRSSLSASLKF